MSKMHLALFIWLLLILNNTINDAISEIKSLKIHVLSRYLTAEDTHYQLSWDLKLSSLMIHLHLRRNVLLLILVLNFFLYANGFSEPNS